MEKIHSFTIDHDEHGEGFYLSSEKNGIITYDLRFVFPNSGNYLPSPVMHTIEHLLATVYRNSNLKDKVIYFGPMGCRTGFYLLLDGVNYNDALSLTIDCVEVAFQFDSVPGASKKECGNYLEHDLMEAKLALYDYLAVLKKIR